MAVILNSTDLYSLMARCLKGESTPQDTMMLDDLLSSDPEMKGEYDHLKSLMHHGCNDTPLNNVSEEAYLQKKFDRITSRLKNEGSL